MNELRESSFPRELSYYSHTLTFIFNLKQSSSTAGEPDREETLANHPESCDMARRSRPNGGAAPGLAGSGTDIMEAAA